jgi:SAM-dependent methyltransferase
MYFQDTKWNKEKTKEFFFYLIYYLMNICYYFFLCIAEYLFILLRYPKIKEIDNKITEVYKDNNQFWVSLKEGYSIKTEKVSNLTYGETSYLAIKYSLDFIKLTSNDVFYDLGCGTGKTVFFANIVYNSKSIGVDLIKSFIDNAKNIVNYFKLKNIDFLNKNLFDLDLTNGTVFYITPTCFDKQNLEKLLVKIKTLSKGSRLIVLSIELNSPNLKKIGQKKLFYSWGLADTFYYEIV